jgi:hypothetical protein
MSYARLMRDQGRAREAYDLLAPVYGWFTEGARSEAGQGAAGATHSMSANSSHAALIARQLYQATSAFGLALRTSGRY